MKKLVLSLLFIILLSVSNAQIQGYNVGDVVDDFTIVTIYGDTINLYSITGSGQYVFIDFFFVTCGPCQATAPHFNQLHEVYGCNQGDIFCMSVNTGNDSDSDVEYYENTYGGDYTPCPISSGDGGSGAVNNMFNPAAYPTICLIGPDNVLLNKDIWPVSSYETFVSAIVATGFTPEPMECTIGIKEEKAALRAFVYPNPATGSISIRLNADDPVGTIEFYNTSGQRIYSINPEQLSSSHVITIDISTFENGLYMARIITKSGQTATARFDVINSK